MPGPHHARTLPPGSPHGAARRRLSQRIARAATSALLLVPALVAVGAVTAVPAHASSLYYVSPTGSDSNPGTQAQPWRTFAKAGNTLNAGDQAVFADGTYNETQPTLVNHADGTAAAPIVFRALNPRKAVINYQGLTESWKLQISRSFVTVSGFSFTQPSRGTTYSDSLLRVMSQTVTNTSIINNRFSNSKQAVKTWGSNNFLFDGNEVVNTYWPLATFNATNVTVRNNRIRDFDGAGMYFKGGSRSVRVYNNILTNTQLHSDAGIVMGGGSCGSTNTSTCGNFDPSGYELYKSVAYNNVIVAVSPGSISSGIKLQGCGTKDGGVGCGVYNNVIVGANWGVATITNNGAANGWTWNVLNTNPEVYNNIIGWCTGSAMSVGAIQGTLRVNNNLFYACPGAPAQSVAPSGDPRFVNRFTDWHLLSGSPATGRGRDLTAGFTGYYGETVDVSRTFDYLTRTTPWNVGVQ